MAYSKYTFSLLLLAFVFGIFCCNDTREPRNDAEIVERDVDTSFNTIPGKNHQGRSVGDEDFEITSGDILETLAVNGMDAFKEAIDSAGLAEDLMQMQEITVFAPTNDAFNKFKGNEAVSKETLQELLNNHVVNGITKTENMTDGMKLITLGGKEITISIQENKLQINDAMIIDTNLAMENGIIHKINSVIAVKK